MIELQNFDINRIEERILEVYNGNWRDYIQCDYLLSLRKDIINQRALAHQEEILPDIIAFNDALTAALREMYDTAHRIWETVRGHAENPDDINLSAKCYLGNDYPDHHPVQRDDRQELWTALCDCGWNKR